MAGIAALMLAPQRELPAVAARAAARGSDAAARPGRARPEPRAAARRAALVAVARCCSLPTACGSRCSRRRCSARWLWRRPTSSAVGRGRGGAGGGCRRARDAPAAGRRRDDARPRHGRHARGGRRAAGARSPLGTARAAACARRDGGCRSRSSPSSCSASAAAGSSRPAATRSAASETAWSEFTDVEPTANTTTGLGSGRYDFWRVARRRLARPSRARHRPGQLHRGVRRAPPHAGGAALGAQPAAAAARAHGPRRRAAVRRVRTRRRPRDRRRLACLALGAAAGDHRRRMHARASSGSPMEPSTGSGRCRR